MEEPGPKACAVLLALRVEVTDEAARGDLRCEGPVDHSDDLPVPPAGHAAADRARPLRAHTAKVVNVPMNWRFTQ